MKSTDYVYISKDDKYRCCNGEELFLYPKMDKVLIENEVWDVDYKGDPNLLIIARYYFYFENYKNYVSGIEPSYCPYLKKIIIMSDRKFLKQTNS